MKDRKSTFALYFGNRGFFPASLQKGAREEMGRVLRGLGHKILTLDEKATRYGAIETPAEGRIYAEFLRKNAGKFDGVILCLPNFGDETGAIAALQDAGVPIMVQAYPDEMDRMAPATRRDAFCGKFSIMDVFVQNRLKFTVLPPHTVHPETDQFVAQVDYFDRLCRVVRGLRRMTVGAIGARTSAFKTVRIDEGALQAHGITMETMDLSDVFARMRKLKDSDPALKSKARLLEGYTCWKGVPGRALSEISRLGVILDRVVDELGLDCLALRCWVELQQQLGISPCVLLSEMNDRGVAAACEVDVGNAITMHALRVASGRPATCLDWNNNFGDEENKCILFHCGPVPQSMMTGPGQITDHAILANAVGEGCGYGCNTGRIAPQPVTFGSLLTSEGKLEFYLGEGDFTDDPIAADFFGCAGVVEIPELQKALQTIGYLGHRHHVSLTTGHFAAPVFEAFQKYLGYNVVRV
jgi:L-fucose isomerase-like protein